MPGKTIYGVVGLLVANDPGVGPLPDIAANVPDDTAVRQGQGAFLGTGRAANIVYAGRDGAVAGFAVGGVRLPI